MPIDIIYNNGSPFYVEKTTQTLEATIDLTNYYTKNEVDILISGVTGSTIDLSAYWTSAQTSNYVTGYTYSKSEVDILLTGVTVDLSGYYTSAQTNNILSGYQVTGLSYLKSEVYNTGQTYSKTEINNFGFLTGFTESDPVWESEKVGYSLTSHTHNQYQVTGLSYLKNETYNTGETYSKIEINNFNFLTGFTESDPIWESEKVGYYTSGQTDNLLNNKLNVTGGTISGNLNISGNLTVSGTSYSEKYQEVEILNNTVTLNSGETGAGVTRGFAGAIIDRGTEPDYLFIFDESTDTFRVGLTGDTIALAGREDNAIDGSLQYWNGSEYQLSSSTFTINNLYKKTEVYNTGETYNKTEIDLPYTLTKDPTGFENTTDSTISFNNSTKEFYISGTYNYWVNGKRYSGPVTGATIADTLNTTYFYISNSNQFTVSNSSWNFYDAQIAYLFNNPSGNTTGTVGSPVYSSDSIMLEERHGITMDWATHERLHREEGAVVYSGFGLSGYTIQTATPAGVQFYSVGGVMADEDLKYTLTSSTPGNYTILYRQGSNASDWRWFKERTLPWISATTYIVYNQKVGSNYQLTELSSNQYVNYYMFATPAITTGFSYILIPGQAVHSTLALAQAESVLSLDFGNLPFTELVALWQITYRCNNTYNTVSGNARIESTPVRLIGQRISITGLISPSDHQALSNRNAASAHPATSVSTDITNFNTLLNSSHTDVQLALDAIDDHLHSIYQITGLSYLKSEVYNTGETYTKNEVDILISGVTGSTVDLSNYWTTAQTYNFITGYTYSKSEVDALIPTGSTGGSSVDIPCSVLTATTHFTVNLNTNSAFTYYLSASTFDISGGTLCSSGKAATTTLILKNALTSTITTYWYNGLEANNWVWGDQLIILLSGETYAVSMMNMAGVSTIISYNKIGL